MILDGQSVSHFGGRLLEVIAKLAPLSIVLAALGLLHNFRQEKAKRDRERAAGVRELLNKLGTKAYLLNWSLIGDSDVSAAVLRIREMIESRVTGSSAHGTLTQLIEDRLLLESIIERAWRDSGINARFQQEALEFGKIRADLGNRIPLVRAALEVVDTKLRMLFLRNVFLVFSVRNDAAYKDIAREKPEARNSITAIHRLLFQVAKPPSDNDGFSEACTFLEKFSSVTAAASDNKILKLLHRRRLSLRRVTETWRTQKERRLDRRFHQELLRKLNASFPSDFRLIRAAADVIMFRTEEVRSGGRRLRSSLAQVANLLRGLDGLADLNAAGDKFLQAHASHAAKDVASENALLELKSAGIDDPDIDMFLASATGVVGLLESALSRGANPKAVLSDILGRHRQNSSGGETSSGPLT